MLESVSAPVEYSADLNPTSRLKSAVTGIPNSKKNSSTSYIPPIGNVAPPDPDLSPCLVGVSGLKSVSSSLVSKPITAETEPGAPGIVHPVSPVI